MLSSPTNPQTRYLYEINHPGPTPKLKLNRQIHLPEIAGDYCISGGGDGGFIFSIPTRCSPDMVAINPSTGRRLPLPPTSTLPQYTVEKDYNSCFEFGPQLDPFLRGEETLHAIKPGSTTAESVTVDLNYASLVCGTATLSPSLDMAILTRSFTFGPNQVYAASLTSSSWAPLPFPNISKIHDSILHKNQLIFIDEKSTIVTMVGSGDPLKPIPIYKHSFQLMYVPYEFAYLLESPDGQELFLVWRAAEVKTFDFLVFRLDTDDGYKWKEVTTLGGLAFFVGPGRSIALSAVDHPCLKPDSIYFADRPPPFHFLPTHEGGLCDIGIFSLKDESIQRFQLTDEEIELKWPPPVWVVPGSC